MKHFSMASSSPIILLIIFSMGLLISFCEARRFLVGGSGNLWKVPLPSPDTLSQWATRSLFRIGDTLVFEYDNKTESVHAVDEEDYSKCNTIGQHLVFNDDNTELEFTEAGTYHFISGNPISCKMGLKLALLVVPKLLPRALLPPPPSPFLPLIPLLSPPPPPFSPSPSPNPSPSPSPSPLLQASDSQGRGDGNVGFIIWLAVSLVLLVFLI